MLKHRGGPVYRAGFTTTRPLYWRCDVCELTFKTRVGLWLHNLKEGPIR